MKTKIFKIFLLNLTLVSTVSVAEVYKCKSDTGNIRYSFEPCESSASKSIPKSEPAKRKSNEIKPTASKPSPLKGIKTKIRKLLVSRNFNELSRVLEGYQQATLKDIATEGVLFTTYDAFELADPKYDSILRAWVKSKPNDYQSHLALGVYYSHLGWESRGSDWASETEDKQFSSMKDFFTEAKSSYEKAKSINSKAMVVYAKLIGLAKAQSDMGDKHAIVREALKVNNKTYKVRQHYLWSIEPRWGGSFDVMQEFVDEAKQYAKHNPKLASLEGMIYGAAARNAVTMKKYSVAETLFTKALEFGENDIVLKNRGKSQYRQKDYEGAIEDLSAAIAINPEDHEYYYWRSKAYYKLKDYQAAKADILKAFRLNAFDENVTSCKESIAAKIVYEGYELVQASKYTAGVDKFNSALELTSDDADIFYRRGLALNKSNMYQAAVSDLKRAIELSPDTIQYYISIDYLYSRQRDWNSILKYWDKFISNHPNNSRAYVERAGTHFHNGNAKAALRDADKARSLGDNNASWVHEKLGQS